MSNKIIISSNIEKELEKELKEGDEGVDNMVNINMKGLASLINEHNIRMYDNNEYNLTNIVNNINETRSSFNSFFIINISSVMNQYKIWQKYMPNIKLYYAVKSNPDKVILNTLVNLGVGFDVASKLELSTVLSFGVSSDRIIYANPIKDIPSISYAKYVGVSKMTFDNEDELKKISFCHPKAELVLRILVNDKLSKMPLGSKFGCSINKIDELFKLAQMLKLKIIGVSFHVGSYCYDNTAYIESINMAREAFKIGKNYNYDMYLLDIGGGFIGDEDETSKKSFIETAKVINETINTLFKDITNLEIIGEIGRFISSNAGILATNIIGKKITEENKEKIIHYYINSSVYNLFNNIVFDKATPNLELLEEHINTNVKYKSVIFGNTCDSLDVITRNIELPELVCGDWLIAKNMGAYTSASSSNFNGLGTYDTIYIFTF